MADLINALQCPAIMMCRHASLGESSLGSREKTSSDAPSTNMGRRSLRSPGMGVSPGSEGWPDAKAQENAEHGKHTSKHSTAHTGGRSIHVVDPPRAFIRSRSDLSKASTLDAGAEPIGYLPTSSNQAECLPSEICTHQWVMEKFPELVSKLVARELSKLI